jgi:hypothetical protein
MVEPNPASDEHLPAAPAEATADQPSEEAVHAKLRQYRLTGRLESIVEHYIEEERKTGAWERILQSGKGKPLTWLQEPENPYIPPEHRLSFKILADAGFAPEWIEAQRELMRTLDEAERFAQRHITWLKGAARGRRHPAGSLTELLLLDPAAAAAHRRGLERYRAYFERANELIQRYNDLAPERQERLRFYRPDEEAARLEQRCRAALRSQGAAAAPPGS